MKQKVLNPISDLLSQAGVINIGITTYEATIPLVLTTSIVFGADVDALIAERDAHEQSKLTLDAKMALVDSIMAIGRNDLTLGRDVLKPHLGYEYSDKYAAIGLNQGSVAIPRTIDGVQSTLGAYKGFFEANALLENATLNITAAHYGTLFNQLLAARGAVNVQKKTIDDLMTSRDAKADKLRKRIRWLTDELDQKIDPLSSLWTAFGLNKPGAFETPDAPEGLQATLIGPGVGALRWNGAPRAEYYRVWKRVVGVDAEFLAAGSPADLDFTLEGLPPGTTIEIAISAVNNGGESARSEKVTLVTH